MAVTIEIEMLAKMAKLHDEMQKANTVVGNTMGSINSAVSGAVKVLGALGIGLSVNYFKNMIAGAINAQDELSKMSQRINVSVENLAGLEFAANLSGTSLTSVEKALKTVSAQMFDVSMGLKEPRRNFDALGISVFTATGQLKSADAVMIEVADTFALMEDGTTKTALATKLFGKSGLELIPMLNEGSAGMAKLIAEGKRYNPVTAESAKQAEIFNDNLDRLKGSVSQVGVSFTNKLLPGLSRFSDEVVNYLRSESFEKHLELIKTAAETLAVVLTVKLVFAVASTTTALIASIVQAVLYQSSLARMAGQSALTAIATTNLGSTVALLGGPAGIMALAAAGVYLLYKAYNDLGETQEQAVANAFEAQQANGTLGLSIRQYESDIIRLKVELEDYTRQQFINSDANRAANRVAKELEETEKLLAAAMGVASSATDAMTDSVAGFVAPMQRVTEQTEEQAQKVAELTLKLIESGNTIGMTDRATAIYAATMEAVNAGALPEQISKIATLAAKNYDLEKSLESTEAATKDAEDAEKDRINTLRDSANKTNALISSLEEQEIVLGLTDRAAAIYKATMEAMNAGALPTQIAKIATLTAKNYDLVAATNAAESAERERVAEVDRATNEAIRLRNEEAKAAQDQWNDTKDYLAETFIDIAHNGGSAFGKIRDAAIAAIERIIAEWLAMKALTALGFSAPISSGVTSGIGSAVASGIGGTVASVGSSLLGGASVGTIASTFGTTAGWVAPSMATSATLAAAGGGAAAGTAAAGTGIWGSITGGLSSAASSVMGVIQAIPGWGWALGAAALAARLIDDSGTMSGNAGMLIRDVPSATADGRTFDVPAFASGFDPIGFARREDQASAIAVIDTFRAYDMALTNIARQAGLNINYSADQFGGYDEKGRGTGLFYGTAHEDGRNTATPLNDQTAQFVSHWIRGLSGQVDGALIHDVLSRGSADAMLQRAAEIAGVDGSHASGLDYVPYDGYRAVLHRGERVQNANEASDSDKTASEIRGLRSDFGDLKTAMNSMVVSANQTARALSEAVRNGNGSLSVVIA